MTNNEKNDYVEKIPILHQAIREDSLTKVNSLLKSREIDLEEKYQGLTPLEASIGSNPEIVKALLTVGASVFHTPEQLLERLRRIWLGGENKKCSDTLLELLKAGINVNARLDEGETILMIAIRKRNLAVVKALIEAGADTNIVPENIIDDRGNFALFEAASIGDKDIFQYLSQFFSTNEILKKARKCLEKTLIMQQRFKDELTLRFMDSVLLGDLKIVVNTIKSGVDINAFSTEETTALWLAATIGNISIVKELIDAEVNLELGREYDSETPLMAAIANPILSGNQGSARKNRQLEIIKMLIQAGANINAKTHDGWTALIAAANAGSIESVKLLLEAGADVNARDQFGDTPLIRAREGGHDAIVRLLEDAGAKEE